MKKYILPLGIIVLLLAVVVMALPVVTNVDLTIQAFDLAVFTDQDNDSGLKLINRWTWDATSYSVLNMPFEGGSNATYTKDYSGHVNDGTPTLISWGSASGIDGWGAYEFDGETSNGSIKIIDPVDGSMDFSTEFSFTAWIKPQPNDANAGRIFDKWVNGQEDKAIQWYEATERILMSFYFTDFTSDSLYSDTGSVPAGEWTHIGATYDGVFFKTYINGVLNTSQAVSKTIKNNNGDIYIGGNPARSSLQRHYNGTIDEVKVYQRTLSPDQIMYQYLQNNNLIAFPELQFNEEWQVCVTPNDGTVDGTEVCGDNFTVLSATCGMTLNQDQAVYGPLTCPNTIFNINASNIILDCNNFDMTFGEAGVDNNYGVRFGTPGLENITIQNCPFIDGNSSGDNNHGITFNQNNGVSMFNNNIAVYGSSNAINGLNSDGTIVSGGLLITHNSNAKGVFLNGSTNHIIAQLQVQNSGQNSNGVHLENSATGVVNDNIIQTNTDNSNAFYTKNTTFTNFIDNNVTAFGDSSYAYYIEDNSDFNSVNGGKLNMTGSAFNTGVLLYDQSDVNLVTGTVIYTTGTSSDGILIYEGSRLSNIYANNISTTGSGSNGIQITDGNNNLLDSNVLATTGAGGILLYDTGGANACVDNDLFNNQINSLSNLEVEDLSASANLNELKYNNSFSSLRWELGNLTTGMSLLTGVNIFLEQDKAGIDLDAERFNLNGETKIEFYNQTWGYTPQIRLDDLSVACPADNCVISHNNVTNITYVNVTNFEYNSVEKSNYTTDFLGPKCGEVMLIDFNMTRNLNCDYHGIIIGADGITGDGKDYNITYGNAGQVASAFGIWVNQSNNANLTDFNIYLGNVSGNGNYGAYIYGANNTEFTSSYIETNTSTGTGIYLGISNYSNIQNNIINTYGSVSDAIFAINELNSVFALNNLTTTGATSWGVQLKDASKFNTVNDNNIVTSGANSAGICLIEGPINNNINDNTVTTGGAGGYPVFLTGTTYTNWFRNNQLNSAINEGILDQTDADKRNYVTYFDATASITWDDPAFLFDISIDDTIGSNNNLYLGNGLAGLNSAVFSTNVQNTSADVIFYGLTYEYQPYILKDGSRCDDDPAICSVVSYDVLAGTLVAHVESWSNYTLQASIQEDASESGGGGSVPSDPSVSCLAFKKEVTTFGLIGEVTTEKVKITNACSVTMSLDPTCEGDICTFLTTNPLSIEPKSEGIYNLIYDLPSGMDVSKYTGKLTFGTGNMGITLYAVTSFTDKLLALLTGTLDIPAQSLFGEESDVVFGIPYLVILLFIVIFTTTLSYVIGRKQLGVLLSLILGFVVGIILDVLFLISQIK